MDLRHLIFHFLLRFLLGDFGAPIFPAGPHLLGLDSGQSLDHLPLLLPLLLGLLLVVLLDQYLLRLAGVFVQGGGKLVFQDPRSRDHDQNQQFPKSTPSHGWMLHMPDPYWRGPSPSQHHLSPCGQVGRARNRVMLFLVTLDQGNRRWKNRAPTTAIRLSQ